MKYMLSENNTSSQSAFFVPNIVADKHIKLATATQLKVLLIALRTQNSEIDVSNIAETLGMDKNEVADALDFWSGSGVITSEQETKNTETERETVVAREEKPSRTDVARRGDDVNIQIILREAQMRFGRNLKSNEASTLVWLYDDKGMSLSLILLLLQYAVDNGKCNISFIEKTAVKWLNNGVETVADAERQISEDLKRNLAWEVVRKTFGIDRAKPSDKELEYSSLWVEKYGFSAEILKCAYDVCVDSTAKLSFSYIAKVLEKWHKNGVKKPEDIKKMSEEKPKKKNGIQSAASYDISAFEKMLYSDD